MAAIQDDELAAYRVLQSRDPRFDGVFYAAVTSTGIYCRPSCPARTPKPANVRFYPSAAAAQCAGFRACRRCLPDATPGSPEWDVSADVTGRAMRLIGDGLVDREGVGGLARRLGYSPRHLNRLLTTTMGAGPLALARARRAQIARALIESSELSLTGVAFAAGFASVRQFNDTMREVYAATPSQLRGPTHRGRQGRIELHLGVRTPFAGEQLLAFLGARAVPGIESVEGDAYSRTLALPHGPATVRVRLTDQPCGRGAVPVQFRLADHRDLAAGVERVRRLLDADADPMAIASHLEPDPIIGPLVRQWPGLRVPGHVDGAEVAVRALLGQQITVAAARTLASRLAQRFGMALPADLAEPGLTRVFPTVATLAGLVDPAAGAGLVDPAGRADSTGLAGAVAEGLPMPRARSRALQALCVALADGVIRLDRSQPRDEVRSGLLAIPGVGPWTADYIAMRALGDPDVFLPTDVGVKNALRAAGADPSLASDAAEAWRPWRSYAQMYLWQSLGLPTQKENTHVDRH